LEVITRAAAPFSLIKSGQNLYAII
jgi:hypothetical protein